MIDANDVPSLATFLDDGGNPGTFLGDMGFRALLYEWIEQMTAAPVRRKHSAALTRRAAADREVESAAHGTLAVVILVWMADVAENLALGERLLDYADALEAAWFTAEVQERFNTSKHGRPRARFGHHV